MDTFNTIALVFIVCYTVIGTILVYKQIKRNKEAAGDIEIRIQASKNKVFCLTALIVLLLVFGILALIETGSIGSAAMYPLLIYYLLMAMSSKKIAAKGIISDEVFYPWSDIRSYRWNYNSTVLILRIQKKNMVSELSVKTGPVDKAHIEYILQRYLNNN